MKQVFTFFLLIFLIEKGYTQGSPITTQTPIMLRVDGNGIRTFSKFIVKEKSKIYLPSLAIPYNVTSKFQIGVILPLKYITPNGEKTNGGFGNVTVFTKYQMYKKDGKAKTFRILGNVKQTLVLSH